MKDRKFLFWDFDGVIKESLGVKSDAFERLFMPFGSAVASRVRQHHERNGGMSRFDKLPLYLQWAGQDASQAAVEGYCAAFSDLARQAVIDSQWVPGAREYLLANCTRQGFFLITATPQQEIEDILGALSIRQCFREIHGAPTRKAAAVADVLQRWQCQAADCLLIGDSAADLSAARDNGVPFLLRRTQLNLDLQSLCGLQCEDFRSE